MGVRALPRLPGIRSCILRLPPSASSVGASGPLPPLIRFADVDFLHPSAEAGARESGSPSFTTTLNWNLPVKRIAMIGTVTIARPVNIPNGGVL